MRKLTKNLSRCTPLSFSERVREVRREVEEGFDKNFNLPSLLKLLDNEYSTLFSF